MDVLYVGGLALFAALTFALISGCGKLMRLGRVNTTHAATDAATNAATRATTHASDPLEHGARS